MTCVNDEQGFDGLDHSSSLRGGVPYEPSIASSASSSQASIFSESCSVQSSIASSISDDFRHNAEDARDRACAHLQIETRTCLGGLNGLLATSKPDSSFGPSSAGYANVTSVPKEHRQHPRRTSQSKCQRPPTLTRQDDRKVNFVESLVDSATQMVEVIWPLSVVPCKSEGTSGRGVLPLRTYIEETLRRSRTSYSTLQVALYYLVLIKPFIPQNDFTQEQKMDCPASRALMCGRRMFLAALILASKYLQDRNYSAKAWSKMSGLKIAEINTNERTFLSKVNWKLHIPEPIFKRWTEIVLKYTPHQEPPSPDGLNFPASTWKCIIPSLTPELDNVPIKHALRSSLTRMESSEIFGFAPPATPTPTPPRTALGAMNLNSKSQESTPTPVSAIPRFLEPKPDLLPPTPALARMGPLPTPQLTPSSVASSTPAASACGSRRPSICSAMAAVQAANFNRCAVDTFPSTSYPFESRRPSITSAASASSRSSPESMISDRSRSSRASSISSISTVSSAASMAPGRASSSGLARQATCRGARIPHPFPPATVAEEKEGSELKPIVIADEEHMVTSPDIIDFSVGEKALHAPHKHSKYGYGHPVVALPERGRKRARPRSGHGRRSDLQEEVRLQLEESDELMEVEGDVDAEFVDLTASPSPAAQCATRMLSRSNSVVEIKETQPPASLSRRGSGRVVVVRGEGAKRLCSSSAGWVDEGICVPLYGEVA